MIIDLKALKKKGLTKAEFHFSYDAPNDILSLPDSKFAESASVDGIVEVYSDEAFVTGTVTYHVDTFCARCLAPVKLTRTAGFDERFVSKNAPYGSVEADENSYFYQRDEIDLKEMVDEIIITDTPYVAYCGEDCKGLCPTCGKNLNDGDCDCNKDKGR